jgi:hypothetical protein
VTAARFSAMALTALTLSALAAGTVLLDWGGPNEAQGSLAGHYLSALTPREAAASASPGIRPAAAQDMQEYNAPYDGLYHFVRVQYDVGGRGGFGGFGRRGRREPMWAHDYPRAERNFLAIMDETTFVRSQTEGSNVFRLNDPELFRYPIAYIVEVGSWNPTDEDAAALGDYLLKGGFLIVDDTRDERGTEFQNFAFHMERALPGHSLMGLGEDHEVFDSFFRIDPLAVIPPYGRRDVQYYAIYEDNDPSKRMMVLMNLNNDIAEYWEFSDRGYYPIDLSNEAYKLGVNYVVYALTH